MAGRGSTVQLNFPQLKEVGLRNFSLYRRNSKIKLEVDGGVTCLAGANGIGKSTFLTAVNYGLTGIVPADTKKLESIKNYVEEGVDFAKIFFEGRIDEDDRDEAEVSLVFEVAGYAFDLTRAAFEPNELRALSVKLDGKEQTAAKTGAERHAAYCSLLVKAVGVKTFEQFVFLQRFVFTFDEDRQLLFWDARALEQALYLAFGGDAELAAQASQLRMEMEKAESRARNVAFHASGVQDRIDEIEKVIADSEDSADELVDLRERHQELVKTRDGAERDTDKAIAKTADAEVALAEASSASLALRKEYETTFAKLTGKRSVVDSHPMIKETMSEARCSMCGSTDSQSLAHIEAAIRKHQCPLCDAELKKGPSTNADMLANLKKIDAALGKARAKLESAVATRTRLVSEKEAAQERLQKADAGLRAFENKNEKRLIKAGDRLKGSGALATTLSNLRDEHETLRAKSKEWYAKRDDFKKDLKGLQRKVESSYAAAEEEFVPMFRELAELFLGLELDIRMESKMATGSKPTMGVTLVLELTDSVRREPYQLSESQRFFVDIALRMAFARFMSAKTGRASLLIDTPEGSLDIAYESRAGEMFAKFAKAGHGLMMTANINSSLLLLKLAAECGTKRMNLVRMTSWADLSEVQRHENKLFQDAYGAIEKKLKEADGKS